MDSITFEQRGTGVKIKVSLEEIIKEAAKIIEWGYGVSARVIFNNDIEYGKQRPGQAFMNVLRLCDMDSYVRLTGTTFDPFYDDSRIFAAIDKLTSK